MYNEQGHFLLRRIFWEHGTPSGRAEHPPLYTLGQEEKWDEEQGKMLPSAYEIYMNSIDEYDAAIKLVKNMKNWGKLVAADWFMNGDIIHKHEGLVAWRDHMKQRDASLAKKILLDKTKQGDTTAAKAVLAETKSKAPVGRKSKKAKASDSSISRISEWKNKQKAKDNK